MDVTTCFTSSSVANRFPARYFLMSPKKWQSLDPLLLTGLTKSQGDKAGKVMDHPNCNFDWYPVISV